MVDSEKNERRVYLVTSCKGGVGKSTVSANLAMAFASEERRVLIVDCDFSNRSLDLIFGVEDRVVYDICDLAFGRADARRAVIVDGRCDRLHFIPAPMMRDDVLTSEKLTAAILDAADAFDCDVVIIDTPGASDDTLGLVAPCADAAVIVAAHQATSVRGAEKMGYLLDDLGVSEQYLIINRYDGEAVLDRKRPGLSELTDKTHVRLIGVIPESAQLEAAQERGELACQIKKDRAKVAAAFDETARRLLNERIPLMSYVSERRRRKLLYT